MQVGIRRQACRQADVYFDTQACRYIGTQVQESRKVGRPIDNKLVSRQVGRLVGTKVYVGRPGQQACNLRQIGIQAYRQVGGRVGGQVGKYVVNYLVSRYTYRQISRNKGICGQVSRQTDRYVGVHRHEGRHVGGQVGKQGSVSLSNFYVVQSFTFSSRCLFLDIEVDRCFVIRMKCVLAKRNAGLTSAGYKVESSNTRILC